MSYELEEFDAFLMAANVEDMRPLSRLLGETVRLSGRAAEHDFEGQEVSPAETNEAIAQFVQDYMFNASTNPPPLCRVIKWRQWHLRAGPVNCNI